MALVQRFGLLVFCSYPIPQYPPTDRSCRYPRTGVPPLAVTRQGPYSYPLLRPNSRTPVVWSPDLSTAVPDLSHDWERSRSDACPGRGGQPVQQGLRTSRGAQAPRKSRTPHGVPGHLFNNRTPHKERSRRPASGRSGADTCLQAQGRSVSILSLTHHYIHCGWWTPALMQQKPR